MAVELVRRGHFHHQFRVRRWKKMSKIAQAASHFKTVRYKFLATSLAES